MACCGPARLRQRRRLVELSATSASCARGSHTAATHHRWSELCQPRPILTRLYASPRFLPTSCHLVSPHVPSCTMTAPLQGDWHICTRTKRSDRGRRRLVELASPVNGRSRQTCGPPQPPAPQGTCHRTGLYRHRTEPYRTSTHRMGIWQVCSLALLALDGSPALLVLVCGGAYVPSCLSRTHPWSESRSSSRSNDFALASTRVAHRADRVPMPKSLHSPRLLVYVYDWPAVGAMSHDEMLWNDPKQRWTEHILRLLERSRTEHHDEAGPLIPARRRGTPRLAFTHSASRSATSMAASQVC